VGPPRRRRITEKRPTRQRVQRKALVSASLFAVLIVVIVFGLQAASGAYTSELANHPDEAAHFVTGVMVHDYLTTALGSNPMDFATTYYARYPKVAFGHWPPGFHVAQAVWYTVLGPSKRSALLLVGAIGCAAGLCLFFRLRRLHGPWVAGLCVGLFLSLPLTRLHLRLVMADLAVSLLCMLALLAVCDLVVRRDRRFWIACAAWSACAVLTKASATALGAFVLLVWGVFRRNPAFRLGKSWTIVPAGLLLAGLYYLATSLAGLQYVPGPGHLLRVHERLVYLLPILKVVPGLVLVVAALGALRAWLGASTALQEDRRVHARAAALCLLAMLLFVLVIRDTMATRYLLPALFPLLVLFAEGLAWMRDGLRERAASPIVVVAALLVLTTVAAATAQRKVSPWRTGYGAVARSIPYENRGPVVLVSSDSRGEGSLIVERLLGDRCRAGVVLRASKVLSRSTWDGDHYELTKRTVTEIREFLNELPVHFVVLDDYGARGSVVQPHHDLLHRALDPRREILRHTVEGRAPNFRKVGEFPIYRNGKAVDGTVWVHENLAARDRHPEVIRIDLPTTLGRELELRMTPSSVCGSDGA
jgi:hypothetical protein